MSNLIDLNSQGQRFTWISKKDKGIIKEMIDRALVNLEWIECYPRTQVFKLPIVGLDHEPVLVDSYCRDLKAPK